MAQILVISGPGVPARHAADQVAARLRTAGHNANAPDGPLPAALRGADAVITVAGQPIADAAAWLAEGEGKPCLVLAGPEGWQGAAEVCLEADLDRWLAAAEAFAKRVRPFAGRLVRDLVPQLVREAGHDMRFRKLDADDRPRFLKQKILEEAKQLQRAGAGEEKEEVADLLEAMEAFLLARGYSRDALRQVKDGKRKRRGGFGAGWVVEETADGQAADMADQDDVPEAPDELDEPASPPPAEPSVTDAPENTNGRSDAKAEEPKRSTSEIYEI